MKLLIVESPSKAATIQKYLGDEYIVAATLGHVVDLGKGGSKGIGVDVNNEFKPCYVILKNKINLLDDLIQKAEKSDEIILATDPDREGEAMAFHLQTRLETTQKTISRVEFREISKKGIADGLSNKRHININLFKAQEARRILDRIVGFMVSPYLIQHFGPNLSAGRVQSVAVRMIVDREKEILSFKPEEYWNVLCKFRTEAGEEFFAKFKKKIKNKTDAEFIINEVKKQKEFSVSVKREKKKEKPCAPMTTAALQQYMAKKYSFEPEKTMKIAQGLYEGGFCTYIRTDSTRISDDAISFARDYLRDNKVDLPAKGNQYAASNSAQDAHECIRPTSMKSDLKNSILAGDDMLVYAAIWQHFIASQMNSAVWDTLSVHVRACANEDICFYTSGKTLTYKGFLSVFDNQDSDKINLPNLTEGQNVVSSDIKSEQKFTQPLGRYNNASIIKELEANQIGRPATYAEIIKKISHRNYVERKGNSYYPTELGVKITNILVELFSFMEYKYSVKMEKQLDEIAAGKMQSIDVIKEFFIPFKSKLNAAYVKNGSTLCEKCNNPMVIKTNSKDQTKFIACSAFPRCHNAKQLTS